MGISNKQKRAIEKISGRQWDSFDNDAIQSYFKETDKGIRTNCIHPSFILLMECHRQHPVTIEMWKADFRKGLLFLWDFLLPEYPKPYIEHAFQIYESEMGYIPNCYREHPLCPEGFNANK
ncbi:hypothetical protein KKE60_07430 [Patescibacteria group bacterium]|nr:hypothetical protein [Patescibacteria group bacterium]